MELLGAYANHAAPGQRLCERLLALQPVRERLGRPDYRRSMRSDAAIEEAIIDEYVSGASTYVIAAQRGLHRQTVSATLRRHGVPTRYNFMTTELLEEATRLRRNGLSFRAIGEELS